MIEYRLKKMQKYVTPLQCFDIIQLQYYITVIHRGFSQSYVCYLVISSSVLASLKVQPEPLCKDDLSSAALWNSLGPNGRETRLCCSPRRIRTQLTTTHISRAQLHPAQHIHMLPFIPLILTFPPTAARGAVNHVWSLGCDREYERRCLIRLSQPRAQEPEMYHVREIKRERGYIRTVSPAARGRLWESER